MKQYMDTAASIGVAVLLIWLLLLAVSPQESDATRIVAAIFLVGAGLERTIKSVAQQAAARSPDKQ